MGNFWGPNWVHHAQGPRRPVISKRHRVIFLHIAHRQGQGISSDDQRNAYCWFKGADFTKVPMVTWRPFRLQEVLQYMVLQSKLCIDLHCCMSRNHMKTRSNIGPIRASQVEWFCSLQFKPRCSPWSLASAMIVFSLAPSLSRASRSSWGTARFENPQSVPASHHKMLPLLSWHNLFFFGSTLHHATIAKTCYVSMSNQLAFELNVPGLRIAKCVYKQASNKTSIFSIYQ